MTTDFITKQEKEKILEYLVLDFLNKQKNNLGRTEIPTEWGESLFLNYKIQDILKVIKVNFEYSMISEKLYLHVENHIPRGDESFRKNIINLEYNSEESHGVLKEYVRRKIAENDLRIYDVSLFSINVFEKFTFIESETRKVFVNEDIWNLLKQQESLSKRRLLSVILKPWIEPFQERFQLFSGAKKINLEYLYMGQEPTFIGNPKIMTQDIKLPISFLRKYVYILLKKELPTLKFSVPLEMNDTQLKFLTQLGSLLKDLEKNYYEFIASFVSKTYSMKREEFLKIINKAD